MGLVRTDSGLNGTRWRQRVRDVLSGAFEMTREATEPSPGAPEDIPNVVRPEISVYAQRIKHPRKPGKQIRTK